MWHILHRLHRASASVTVMLPVTPSLKVRAPPEQVQAPSAPAPQLDVNADLGILCRSCRQPHLLMYRDLASKEDQTIRADLCLSRCSCKQAPLLSACRQRLHFQSRSQVGSRNLRTALLCPPHQPLTLVAASPRSPVSLGNCCTLTTTRPRDIADKGSSRLRKVQHPHHRWIFDRVDMASSMMGSCWIVTASLAKT